MKTKMKKNLFPVYQGRMPWVCREYPTQRISIKYKPHQALVEGKCLKMDGQVSRYQS